MASTSGTKRLARNERSGPPAKRSTQKSTNEDSTSDSESTSDSKYFFHYTNKKGRDAIKKQGFIKASGDVGVDAAFGKGVYLTSVPPLEGKVAVARNNWKQAFNHALKNRKLDYVILILMPVDDVERAKTKRDVYLYEGPRLVLKKYHHEILTWKEAVKRCTELVLQVPEEVEDEESYDDDVDHWMSDIFPY